MPDDSHAAPLTPEAAAMYVTGAGDLSREQAAIEAARNAPVEVPQPLDDLMPYVTGWRWGFLCGFVCASVFGSAGAFVIVHLFASFAG